MRIYHIGMATSLYKLLPHTLYSYTYVYKASYRIYLLIKINVPTNTHSYIASYMHVYSSEGKKHGISRIEVVGFGAGSVALIIAVLLIFYGKK